MRSKCLFQVFNGSLGLAFTSKHFKSSVLWVRSVAEKTIPSQHHWRVMLRQISPQNLCFVLCSGVWRGHLGHLSISRKTGRWICVGQDVWRQTAPTSQLHRLWLGPAGWFDCQGQSFPEEEPCSLLTPPTHMSRFAIHPELAPVPGILGPMAQIHPGPSACTLALSFFKTACVQPEDSEELLKSKASQFLSLFLTGPRFWFLSHSKRVFWSLAPALL